MVFKALVGKSRKKFYSWIPHGTAVQPVKAAHPSVPLFPFSLLYILEESLPPCMHSYNFYMKRPQYQWEQ